MVTDGNEGERVERKEEKMRVDEQARARESALKGLGGSGRCQRASIQAWLVVAGENKSGRQ